MQLNRYAPEVDFPPYAFVPGRYPHPVTNPGGHGFGKPHLVPEPLDPQLPNTSQAFLNAIDLFNAGYYWEAHEAWEGLWIAAGRTGTLADFLKGLIKLAAAGVKARGGNSIGVQRHAARAAELFHSVRQALPHASTNFAGLSFDVLIAAASSLAASPTVDDTPSVGGNPVLSIRLALMNNTSAAL